MIQEYGCTMQPALKKMALEPNQNKNIKNAKKRKKERDRKSKASKQKNIF